MLPVGCVHVLLYASNVCGVCVVCVCVCECVSVSVWCVCLCACVCVWCVQCDAVLPVGVCACVTIRV